MMADLKVTFAGLELKNPLMLASATPGWDGQRLKCAGQAGFGAVISKTISPRDAWLEHPRNGRMVLYRVGNRPVGMINMELFTTQPKDEWFEKEFSIAKEGGAKICASILAMPDPEITAEIVEEVQETGLVDFFEMNVSCPMPSKGVGMHIGKNAKTLYEQIKAVKSVAKIPVMAKFTPGVSDIVETANAAVEGGVDAIAISNTVRSFAGVDVETGRPVLRSFGGYSGPAIKPITMALLAETARSVDIPISAVGGVSSWQDVVEYIMLGATTVQLATSVMWKGWGIVQEILDGLAAYMDEKGYKSIEDFRGKALPYISTVEELCREPALKAEVNQELCINCGKCHRACFYDGVKWDEDHTWIDQDNCDGCGLCAQWCPQKAISLK
jgi:dihydropyrimidine dehydrogenase (NAD+) subunit PreA